MPISRPAFPLRGRYAPARGAAHDALGRFADRDRDRPLEAPRPRDENPDVAAERVRGDPGFERLREALAGGLDGRFNALPPGGGDAPGRRMRSGRVFREVSGAPRKPRKPEVSVVLLHGHRRGSSVRQS